MSCFFFFNIITTCFSKKYTCCAVKQYEFVAFIINKKKLRYNIVLSHKKYFHFIKIVHGWDSIFYYFVRKVLTFERHTLYHIIEHNI